MLSWFGNHAPIRLKFKVLLLVHTVIAAAIAAAAIVAATHATGVDPRRIDGIALGGVAAIPMTTFVASRLICTPYVTTVVRMEAMAAGDLHSEVLYTGNGDCVGRMTKAMDIFVTKSIAAAECDSQRAMALSMGEGLGSLAKGNLTHRITAELTGAFAPLKADFNDAIAQLEEVVGSVALAADGVNTGASEIRTASDQLSQRTEQQAASLEQTTAALAEMTQTVRETASDAGRASEEVERARGDAETGAAVVRRAVAAMSDIERSSAEISEIISVIDGIAFQTNLLALNAGIEAARAGDAGKGFAVVASEVRALAQRSAEAAKDVKVRILRSAVQVDVGVTLVNESGQALDRITGRVAEMSLLVSGIAAAAARQSGGLQEINTALAQMDGMTQQNAAMVEEATGAAQNLAGEAANLVDRIARFSVGRATPQTMRPKRAATAANRAMGTSRPTLVRSGGLAVAEAEDRSRF